MGKFFLPEARMARPKHKQDYRLIAYKEILQIVKAKHQHYISKVIKEIKSSAEEHKPQLQTKLNELKQMKKKEMKLATLYVMATVLNVANFSCLEKLLKMESKATKGAEEVKTQVDSNDGLKKFIGKVMQEKPCRQVTDKLGDLKNDINKKKMIAKEKSKQRKAMKLMRRKMRNQGIENGLQQGHGQHCIEPQSQSEKNNRTMQLLQPQSNQNSKEEMDENQNASYKGKNDFWKKNQQKKVQKQPEQKVKETGKKQQPQRTQFIKKGRNKVKQEKRNKKFNRGKQIPKKEEPKEIKKQPKQNKTLHPSWQAKQQLANKGCITAFAGKKILL